MGLQDFLKQIEIRWPNQANNVWILLSKHGHPGIVTPFTKDELAFLKKLKKRVGRTPVGRCYMNAQKLALAGIADPRVQYVEGLVTVHNVPIDHAWIEFNGKVYDPTINDGHDHEYHGVVVPKNEIMKFQSRIKTYSPLTHWCDDTLFAKIWRSSEMNA